MILEGRSRRLRFVTHLVAFLILALPGAEAVSAEKKTGQEKKAARFARKILKTKDSMKAVRALNKISLEPYEVRTIYYEQVLKVARSYVETTGDGPLIGAARFLLCGTETCEPARYGNLEFADELDMGGVAWVEGGYVPPVKLYAPQPQYTEIARLSRIQGQVIIHAIVDEQGTVKNGVVFQGLPMGLAENALEAVKRWEFQAASLDGDSIAVYFSLTVHFRLQQ